MIILGLDPGTAITGYGIIKIKRMPRIIRAKRGLVRGQKSKIKSENDEIRLINYGCITTKPDFNTAERLLILAKELKKIIKKYKPDLMGVEDIFFFKNLKTAIRVSEARGVILLAGEEAKLQIFEYTPLQVKQAVVGYGRAEKRQVQEMVKILLKLKDIPKPDDVADALAVAICCGHSVNSKLFNSSKNSKFL